MTDSEVISIYSDTRNGIQKVPYKFWCELSHIETVVKYIVEEELCIPLEDVPKVLRYDVCLKLKLRQPLKYFGHSPYKLINFVYKNRFSPLDFDTVPKDTYRSIDRLKTIAKEKIHKDLGFSKEDIKTKMTRELIITSGLHKVCRVLADYDYALMNLLELLYPGEFKKNELIFYKFDK